MFEVERTTKEVTYVKIAICGDNETLADRDWNHENLCSEDRDAAVIAGIEAFGRALDRYYVTFFDPAHRSADDAVISYLYEWQRKQQFADIKGRFYAASFWTAEVEATVIDDETVEFTDMDPEPGAATPQLRERVRAILEICDNEAIAAAQAVIDDAIKALDEAMAAEAQAQ